VRRASFLKLLLSVYFSLFTVHFYLYTRPNELIQELNLFLKFRRSGGLLSFVFKTMFRKYLVFLMVICYSPARAQTNYILHPGCTTTSDKPLVVFFTGDSGRSRFDEKLTDSLCANNIPFMCINSYKYFRRRKTPQQTLDSILPYIDLNLKKYNRRKFIFAGYSFGSEVVPFLYNLMSVEWKEKVEFIVLLSPSYNSDFKIHFLDRVGFTLKRWPYDVLHEIMKIEDKKIIVFWGQDENKFEKKEFTKHNITVHHLKGGHRHIDVKPVIDEIIERIEEGATAQGLNGATV
jgi:type IV secretory pathway VirJ component